MHIAKGSKEFEEMQSAFERIVNAKNSNLGYIRGSTKNKATREEEAASHMHFYHDDEVNKLFLAFWHGCLTGMGMQKEETT